MPEMLRFFYIALREYWITWVTGTGLVGFSLWMLNLYDKRRSETGRKPMSWRTNALILFCTFWFLATFSAWHDADKNLTSVIQQRSKDNGNFAICKSDLKTEGALKNVYQTQASNMQALVNESQATLNACVTGSMEKLRTKVQGLLIASKLILADPQIASHSQGILLMSSQTVAVDFGIHCNLEIVNVTAGLINTSVMFSGGGGGRQSAHDWRISIGSPLLTPTTPLNVIVYYNQPGDLVCTFTRMGV